MIITPWYTPAFKAGGPIQSCIRLVAYLRSFNSIQLITSGYDLKDKRPIPDIPLNENLRLESNVRIKYLSHEHYGVRTIKEEIVSFDPDFIYINGLFSKPFVIDIILAHWLMKHRSEILLTVHGACKPSALKHKRIKKAVFLSMVKFLGIQNRIKFHASNEEEHREILNVFKNAKVEVINTLPPVRDLRVSVVDKVIGQINLIFIGRVHPIKNLQFVFEVVKHIDCKVSVKILGPVDDQDYFQQCMESSKTLPENIEIIFEGEVPHLHIYRALKHAHFLILPTLGENYGYAIIEALAAGRPVIISDQTPWKNLEVAKAGWDLPLSDTDRWVGKLKQAASWDQTEFNAWCHGALEYAREHTNSDELFEKYKRMFNEVGR